MKHTSQWILTPCGTSILTNNTERDTKAIIFQFANAAKETDIPDEPLKKMRKLIDERTSELMEMGESEAGKASAELNALIKFLRKSSSPINYHCLLPTDTWLGRQTAGMIQQWLEQNYPGTKCEILHITGLQTDNFSNFQLSLSDLSQQLIERTEELKKQKTHIAFNLTGGFKAISGFLQVLATCLADESFYIFERSDHILSIPKLPMEMTSEVVFLQHIQTFRRLALGLSTTDEEIQKIPSTLIFSIDGSTILSALGQLQWDAAKKDIYRSLPLSPPSKKIAATPGWLATFKSLDPSRRHEVNKRMDELACYLEAPNKGSAPNPKTLNFKSFTNNKAKKGIFQIYAWSDRDARRICGHFLDSGIFQLDSIEKHS